MKALEIVARVLIVYVACMVLLRVSGRREMSELSPMDLLAMLLLSETVSPALTGGDESVTAGLIAACALIGLTVLTAWLAFRSRKAEKILHGEAVILINDGKVITDVLRRYHISADDLETAMHQQGLLHVDQVKRAYLEADGKVTMIKRKEFEEWQEDYRHALEERHANQAAGRERARDIRPA